MTTSANPTLHQLLDAKLRPHAERVVAGAPNEFDYLPAALHHAAERDSQTAHLLMTAASQLKQIDADNQERLSDLSLKTRERITQLEQTSQRDQEQLREQVAKLGRRTNLLLYLCLGTSALTVVLSALLFFKR